MQDLILAEAKRLHSLGFAILWIKPKSKQPVESGWTSGPRADWNYLKETYFKGLNVGVRLGTASKIGSRFLAVIDIDVKSTLSNHRKEALAFVNTITNSVTLPEVTSGRGNGSRHLYILTDAPVTPRKLAQSPTIVKVSMPSVKPSKRELAELTKEELDEGLRLRPAWEVGLMGEGQQVVLPPSTHPDSGKPYAWAKNFDKNMETFDVSSLPVAEKKTSSPSAGTDKAPAKGLEGFEVCDVELSWLPLHDKIRNMITTGEGVEDRSAMLLPICEALVKAGLGKNEVLSVLTDKQHWISGAAYEHAKTNNRTRAAAWVWRYSLAKVWGHSDMGAIFSAPLDEEKIVIDEKEIAAAEEEIEENTWQDLLEVNQYGKRRNTMFNIHLILTKVFGPKIFRHNEFCKVDEVWTENPWGMEIGSEFEEVAVQKIKLWTSVHYGFQPSDDNIFAAVICISHTNKYHPVQEYLKALPTWDGVKRVDNFLKVYMKGEAPEKYLQAISRKTIVAMITRVFEPGCKFDTMLVLEGDQGLKKSTAIQALTSAKWFSDVSLNLENKDSISDLNGKWVIEHGEMNALNQHDVNVLKQFLARGTDRMRPPYGRKSQDFPRQSIFIGSTNENIYLKDKTGNRRFWPFKVTGPCDAEAIRRDRDQIFAEAMTYYNAGEPIWIEDSATEHLAKLQQAERETSDELVEVISEWLEKKENEADFDNFFDINRLKLLPLFDVGGPIFGSIFRDIKPDQAGQRRVADCLRALGYQRKVIRNGGKIDKMWVRNE